MELVTGLGVFSILVLIASILSTWAVYRYYSVRDRLIAEATAYRAESLFRNTFGQAIDINFTGTTVPASVAGATGVIHGGAGGFLFDEMADSADWTRIATFYREQGTALENTGVNSQGRPAATTVFYRRPTLVSSGVIFFDLSTLPGQVAATSPDYGDVFVDRVSTFGMEKFRHPNFDKTTNIEVFLRIRYHTFAGRANNWCPQNDIRNGVGGCNNGATIRDFDKRFNIFLAHNLIKAGGVWSQNSAVEGEERAQGNMYFFRTINPLGYQ